MHSPAERDLILPEDDAQAVALVQAVEEADRSGALLPLAARREATVRARAEAAGDAAWLAARARELAAGLEGELAFLPRLGRLTRPVRGLLAPAVAVAFVLGLATNALGPEQRINVLALPLLGLIAWNLAVLMLTAARAWLPLPAALRAGAPRFVGRLEAMGRRLVERLPRRADGDAERDRLERAMKGYLSSWLPATAPLAAARGRRLLHASSLALVLGVVAGMYLRGVAFRYQATWESTFLSYQTVDRFLGTALAPAAALLGEEVPSTEGIDRPPYGDAAPWIHLWAVTAALFVGVPRSALLALDSVRCARLARRLHVPLADGYVRRLLASADTAERRLEVVPYSYRPPGRSVETLKRLLYDLVGPRSEIRLRSPLEYGVEPDDLETGGRLTTVLFGLAQTPEAEVHGELLAWLKARLPDGQALLVLVDTAPYRQRLEGDPRLTDRLVERRRAWDRVARAEGLTALHLDLGEALPDDALTRAAGAVWPAGALEGDG